MFTGLVQDVARVVDMVAAPPGKRLTIESAALVDAAVGDSVAINGCCLTAIALDGPFGSFEAGPETLARTNLGELVPGAGVNIELSLRLGDRIGGHLVSGHIDAVGILDERRDEGSWSKLWFSCSAELARLLAAKGSIAVDGVSLTLVDVEPERFSVALIPHTLAATTLGRLAVGGRVNLEADLLAKYVERQLQTFQPPASRGNS
jgi:riboflavin synthase